MGLEVLDALGHLALGQRVIPLIDIRLDKRAVRWLMGPINAAQMLCCLDHVRVVTLGSPMIQCAASHLQGGRFFGVSGFGYPIRPGLAANAKPLKKRTGI